MRIHLQTSSLALLAASAFSAHAADAVLLPEPEPVEYVRICDAYGAGFFYIPGTETCLRMSGYVRYQIGATSDEGPFDTPNYNGFLPDGWNKTVRARLNFDTRSETEWGTLRSYIRFQATWNGVGDGPVFTDQAWLSLGGLRMGYSESAWADTVVGGVPTNGSHSDNGMSYGDQQRAFIQYNFQSNGFFGVLSLEDDDLDGDGYMPDVVGVLGYASGWGGIWARAGYDESFDGSVYDYSAVLPGFIGVNDGGFGASVGTQVNVPNMEGSSLRVIGYYSDGDHTYGVLYPSSASTFVIAPGGGLIPVGGNSEWSILASYAQQFTETFGASVGYQYFNDFYFADTDVLTGLSGYEVELALVWYPVTDFEVRTEIDYDKIDTLDGTVSGFLRFQRNF